MKIEILFPDQQPAARTLAARLAEVLPQGAKAYPVSESGGAAADLVIAVFTLKEGSFAPTVGRFRELRDKKVALVPILTGPVERSRVMKTVWGSKKQFCGNYMTGAYLCPATGKSGHEMVDEAETAKAQAFALKILGGLESERALAA